MALAHFAHAPDIFRTKASQPPAAPAATGHFQAQTETAPGLNAGDFRGRDDSFDRRLSGGHTLKIPPPRGNGYEPLGFCEPLLPILARARRRAIRPLLRGMAMRSPGLE